MGGIGGRIMGDTAAEPGARGVLLAVPLAIAAAVFQLGFYTIAVDDRGEQLPRGGGGAFRGLYIATREALTGRELDSRQDLASSAIGPFYILMTVVALVAVFGVFYLFRYRRSQSMYWTVTIGMLVLAATVLLIGQAAFIGSMAAMTWASFQIRRAELPAKMAEREAVRAARAEAAAAEEADDEDEYDEDAYEEEAYDEEAYEEGDADADAEADEDDGTEYDEDAYEEEAYEEDAEYEDDDEVDDDTDVEVEDEPAATASDDEESATVDAGNGAAPTEAADPDERIVDYDEDILKDLEAEIDEGEKGGGSGSSPR